MFEGFDSHLSYHTNYTTLRYIYTSSLLYKSIIASSISFANTASDHHYIHFVHGSWRIQLKESHIAHNPPLIESSKRLQVRKSPTHIRQLSVDRPQTGKTLPSPLHLQEQNRTSSSRPFLKTVSMGRGGYNVPSDNPNPKPPVSSFIECRSMQGRGGYNDVQDEDE